MPKVEKEEPQVKPLRSLKVRMTDEELKQMRMAAITTGRTVDAFIAQAIKQEIHVSLKK